MRPSIFALSAATAATSAEAHAVVEPTLLQKVPQAQSTMRSGIERNSDVDDKKGQSNAQLTAARSDDQKQLPLAYSSQKLLPSDNIGDCK